MTQDNPEKPQVLIVDDEKQNLSSFKYMFDDCYTIYTAESADEGFEIMCQHDIRVVISDQRMPQKTGVEFLEQVLQEFPDTVRMILTAYSDFDAIVEAINKGKVYYYFSKPWDEKEMKLIIDNALEALELKRKLKENEERFRQLAENVKEVFLLVSPDWNEVYYVSPAFEEIWGKPVQTMYDNALSWLQTVLAEDRDQIKNQLSTDWTQAQTSIDYPEFRIQKPDGSIRWILARGFPIIDKKGKVFRIAAIVEDISEQKKAIELKIQTEKIMSIGGLADGLAHELNNPLSGILQGVQLLQERLTTGLQSEEKGAQAYNIDLENMIRFLDQRRIIATLNNVSDCGIRATKIISDMVAFSQNSKTEKSHVDLGQIIEKVIEISSIDYDLKQKYKFDTIEIIRDFTDNLPLVFCSANEICQVLLNLIENAAQVLATDQGKKTPSIRIGVKPVHEKVIIELEDNGPGIEKSVKKRIFDPFFTTKKRSGGTGLGLSISYAIITQNHNGTLDVESSPGNGTTFTIGLPMNEHPQCIQH